MGGRQRNQSRAWKKKSQANSTGLDLGSGLREREKFPISTTWCRTKFKVKTNRLAGQKFHPGIKMGHELGHSS